MNKKRIARAFNYAVNTFDDTAVLYREVGTRMMERLSYINIQPKVIVDLGASTGLYTEALKKRYKRATVIAVDIAEDMLKTVQEKSSFFTRYHTVGGDVDALPFADNSVDLLFSNLVFHWTSTLENTLKECQRVLKPNGIFLFSVYGPSTLQELRHSFASVDNFKHVNDFHDMHDIGDMLLHAHFAEPVLDTDRFTLQYHDIYDLMRDQKKLGAQSILGEPRQMGLTGKHTFKKLEEAYESYRTETEMLPATYEVVFAHAFGTDYSPEKEKANAAKAEIPIAWVKREGSL